MYDPELRVTPFERHQLPDLFQGRALRDERTTLPRLLSGVMPRMRLVAVWADRPERLNPLPQLILGSEDALNDLCAWSKAYMTGVGPLSGLIRLLQPEQLAQVLRIKDLGATKDLEAAGRQIGIIFAEVAARSSPTSAMDKIGLKACLNTLSFCIFRAANLGLRIEPEEIAHRWASVRGRSSRGVRARISEAVLGSVNMTLKAPPSDVESLVHAEQRWLKRSANLSHQLPFDDPSEVESALTRLLSDPELVSRPKEDLVRFLDQVLPELVTSSAGDSSKKHLLGALLVAQASRGLSNQFSLLGRQAAVLPDLVLWLGVIQGFSPAAETLSSFNGVGWKLLSQLTESFDPLRRPDFDISFEEAQVYDLQGRGQFTDAFGGASRLRVEIACGISTEVSADEADSRSGGAGDRGRTKEPKRNLRPMVEDLEQRLIDAMDLVRRLKAEQVGRSRQ